MDPQTQFCHNSECPARVGWGRAISVYLAKQSRASGASAVAAPSRRPRAHLLQPVSSAMGRSSCRGPTAALVATSHDDGLAVLARTGQHWPPWAHHMCARRRRCLATMHDVRRADSGCWLKCVPWAREGAATALAPLARLCLARYTDIALPHPTSGRTFRIVAELGLWVHRGSPSER